LQKLPLDFPWRTSFQHAQGEVYTNHYQISISPDLRLYKYTIESDLAGRNKRKIRALIKTAITSYSFLGDNEASFATDHFATVIAWKPLHSAIDTQHLQIQGDGNARGSAWQLQPDLRDEPNDVRVKFTYEGIVDVGSLLKHTDIDKDFAKADLEPTKHALNTAISKCH
jgi:eukaryotic translation initiation factor 2C